MLRRLYQTVVESPSGVQIRSETKEQVRRRALESKGPTRDSGALTSDLNLPEKNYNKTIPVFLIF